MEPLSLRDLCLSRESTSKDSKRQCRFPEVILKLVPPSLICRHFRKSLRKSALPPGPPPRFPIEIIQLIIHEAWELPLTTSERVQFTKSSLLVSLSWMGSFARESCVHVHLLSGEHTKYWYKPITSGSQSVYSTIAGLDGPTPPGATHPTHPMCLATNLISSIVCHGGFDNFEGCVIMQFPLTVNIALDTLMEEDVKWRSSHDIYTVSITPQFWKVKIKSCIAELYDVLEKLVLWVMQSRWDRVKHPFYYDFRTQACIWAWYFLRYGADAGKVVRIPMIMLNAADYNPKGKEKEDEDVNE
ncbi:hypothetical protein BT96DRAFT_981401 [Gymnopus androsaceus JB14]|uniref:Uncharacterized protein n=1 Tax=Gymnopus androsaceus JB14 TaxID=1447944 RepID=A0A6A4GQL9_9AGAR|nr:hypothetical protein BT96DRAFT_981401 [Gymnopus androsaceus JB14]